MSKFKIKLLYNEKEFFWTKTGLLNFKLNLPLAKLVMVGARLTSNGLIYLGNILSDVQLMTFLLLSNISELSIRVKTKKKNHHHHWL